jgi:hypothetical protein
VPQFGHGSAGAGGRILPAPGPGDGASSGQGAGAGTDPLIRIPHASQKSVLADSWPNEQVAI